MLPGNTMLSAGSLGRTTSGVAAGAYGYSQFTQNGGGTHSTASSSRFVPSQFQYNGRVAAALLPSVLVLAGYGGGAVAAALAVGLMATYILDAMRYKEGAFMAAWLTMGAANLAAIFSALLLKNDAPVALTLLTFLLNALTLFLAGLWASLQFRFLQLQYPGVVIAFEKMLMAGCLPVAAAVQTWGMVAGVGMSNSCFFLAAMLCGLYRFFALPLPSSFHLAGRRAMGGGKPKAHRLQDSGDGLAAFLLVAALPAGVYVATHWAVLLSWVHMWSLILLASGPLVFVCSLQDGLWWLGSGRAVNALRRLVLLASLAIFLLAVEERVIFHSFNQYIRLTAPWNYIAVTACMYGVAALVLLHFSGSLSEEAEGLLVGPLLMLSAAVGALAAGLPLWMLPAPLLAASGLAMFYDTRSLRDYLLFVAGALATGGWFVWHHFWFLEVSLAGVPLRTVCALVLAAMVPAALLPGMLYAEAGQAVVGGLLVGQAALLCWLEELLYAGGHEQVTHGVHSMYPPWLVVGTSALGLALARHLHACAAVGDVPAYVLQCAYAAKLSMLLLPEARLTVPVLGVLLAASPPLLLHKAGASERERLERPGRQRRLPAWQGLGLAALVLLSVVASRFAIFDIVQFVVDRRPAGKPAMGHMGEGELCCSRSFFCCTVQQAIGLQRLGLQSGLRRTHWWPIRSHSRNLLPSHPPLHHAEALVAGILVLCMALGCLPLVHRYYPASQAAKRALLLAGTLAALLALLRPPLPVGGGAECPDLPFGLCPRLWDAGHVPEHEEDDVAIWGDGLRRRTHWPLWFMLGSAFLGVTAMTQTSRGALSALLRTVQAAGSAAMVAAYLALEFFPGLPLVQVVILVSALLAALFLVLLQLPVPGGAVLMPGLALAWAAGLPLALAAQAASALPPLPEAAERLLPDSDRELDEERRDAIWAAILAVYVAESLLLAFALKLRVGAALAGQRGAKAAVPAACAALGLDDGTFHRAASFLGQCMPTYVQQPGASRPALKGPAGAAMQRLGQEGLGWVPTCCNLVALLCFGLCMVLNWKVTGGNPAAILLLAPLLLLLAQDPLLLRALEERRRYAPPVAATTVYLTAAAGWQLVEDVSEVQAGGTSLSFFAIQTGCLIWALPCQVFLLIWLWTNKRPPVMRVLLLAPLNLAALYLADLDETKLSAGVGLAASAALLLGAQQAAVKAGRNLI